jgi:FkbM family methyltransferase
MIHETMVPSKKRGFSSFQIAFMTIPLLAVASLHFTAAPFAGVLWVMGKAGACPFLMTLQVPKAIERQNKVSVDIMKNSTRSEPDSDGFSRWETPYGVYWAPAATPVHSLLSEQVVRFYGDGARRVQKGDVVLDCGANIGTFVREALNAGAAKIIAIEPSKRNVESLHRNFREDIQSGRVVVYPKGLWNEETRLKFYAYDNSSLDSVVMETRAASERAPDVVTVPVTTIDKLCEELGLHRVDFIKMDIEGAEMRALEGARRTIAKSLPRMALATENMKDDQYELPRWVRREFPSYEQQCGRCSAPGGTEIRADVFYFSQP